MDPLLAEAAHPTTSQTRLAELAQQYPFTRMHVLSNPNCYEGLREWILAQEAVSARTHDTPESARPVAAQKKRGRAALVWSLIIALVLTAGGVTGFLLLQGAGVNAGPVSAQQFERKVDEFRVLVTEVDAPQFRYVNDPDWYGAAWKENHSEDEVRAIVFGMHGLDMTQIRSLYVTKVQLNFGEFDALIGDRGDAQLALYPSEAAAVEAMDWYAGFGNPRDPSIVLSDTVIRSTELDPDAGASFSRTLLRFDNIIVVVTIQGGSEEIIPQVEAALARAFAGGGSEDVSLHLDARGRTSR